MSAATDIMTLLWRGVAVFRIITVQDHHDGFARPDLGWLAFAGIALWTVLTCLAYSYGPRRGHPAHHRRLARRPGPGAVRLRGTRRCAGGDAGWRVGLPAEIGVGGGTGRRDVGAHRGTRVRPAATDRPARRQVRENGLDEAKVLG
ncbi:MAG: hypothetical protein ACRDRA_16520 [Pseudonocardiaceae bacterium]